MAVLARRHLCTRIESVVTITPTSTPVPTPERNDGESDLVSGSRGHIGRVVAGSLVTGLVAAIALALAPFIPAEAGEVTGAVLCGFALGWAMLYVLSVRFTDQPQRWAAAPALFLGVSGLLLVTFGSSVSEALSWIWPPVALVLVVWMVGQAHRHLHSRSRRGLLYPVIALTGLVAVGGGYETVSAATHTDVAMPGQLINVDGHNMHLNCTGSGSPTVVLQPGGGAMSSDMGWIAPRVATESRVCVYDRPGRGWSEPVDSAQDATDIANDLHTLLQRGNVPGPYVLAGHSFGGLYVLTYADLYPDEVAGMVVIDTTAPKDEPTTSASNNADSYEIIDRIATLVSTSSRFGVTRLEAMSEVATLPPQSSDEARASLKTGDSLRAFIDEFLAANASMGQAAALTDFADKPLVILTAGVGSGGDFVAAHEQLATLSTNGVHRVIDGATHETLLADEKDSEATTQAVFDVLASVRGEGPLPR
jgi:pimeloyl-ACP methyl ester carboxylesterase